MNQMTKMFLMAVLLLMAASFAAAQEYSYTYTAPVGAISCSTRNLGTYPVIDGRCALMPGFRSQDNLYSANFENGQTFINFRIFSVATGLQEQVVQANNPVWTPPDTFPAAGVSATFTMTAPILAVCTAECVAASGDLTLAGQWSWQYKVIRPLRGTPYTIQIWTNTSPVVINGQSTVAILDELQRQRQIQARIQADLDNDPCEPIILFPWDGPDEPIIIYPQIV